MGRFRLFQMKVVVSYQYVVGLFRVELRFFDRVNRGEYCTISADGTLDEDKTVWEMY
jgi:hypothetical protein